ncbi:hypothetical protein DFH07DRAFT_951430 [Mycena maculata]|uniref:Uncharacterized protein n=1 Tax=Mycena maculata TaxID=230809 RepID=A0AAD7NVG8_9AGAR|nr:hypothetical protein DFH07DRAFT_951430 [Mycena maculata]
MSIHSSSSISGSQNSGSGSSTSVHSVANTVTSTTALTAAYRPPQKDYAAAFAMLQGQYGMGGDFPAAPHAVQHTAPVKKKQRKPVSEADGRGVSSTSREQRPPTSPTTIPVPPIPRLRSVPLLASPSARAPPAQLSGRSSADGGEPAPMVKTQEDKGKSSGVSRLKKILGVRFKGAFRETNDLSQSVRFSLSISIAPRIMRVAHPSYTP